MPLPVLLTTEELIVRDAEGALGPVWLEPADGDLRQPAERRRRWLLAPMMEREQAGGQGSPPVMHPRPLR